MKEKLMQDIIIKYPSEVLDEEGLAYVNREVKTGSRRLDIVLKDKRDRFILLEAQVGNLDTQHIDRHIDFVEGFLENNPSVDVRIMFVSFVVDPLKKTFLQRRGYEFKEISRNKFLEIAEKYNLLTGESEEVIINNHAQTSKKENSSQYKSHAGGHSWDHNKEDNQDGFINTLIKKGKTLKEIEFEFSQRFKDHPNPVQRVRRHINHLKNDHKDFPYEQTGGKFVLKKAV
jgi:hypothetical protein